MNYQDSLDFLYQRLPMFQRIGKPALKPDLSNTLRLLNVLNQPEKQFKSVHIAGTNGKGSSAHAIASILQSAGLKTGLYTSPHLVSFTERIRINGRPIDEESVASFVTQMKEAIETITPSFFEVTVAMAFDYFRKKAVDIAVIEVGLGGRLDSTNIITPEVSLITTIAFDHMDLLGDTLPKIATEKAGIIKPNVPVVIGHYQEETFPVFVKKAAENNSPLILADQKIDIISTQSLQNRVSYQGHEYVLDNPASYYAKNIPGILETINILKNKGFDINEKAVHHGLENMMSQTGLLGRFQVLEQSPLMIADVSHNEQGISNLLEQISAIPKTSLHIIYGTVKDKDVIKILKLFPKQSIFYFTQSQSPRALVVDELMSIANSIGINAKSFQNVNEAILSAKKETQESDLILITGSTFVIAEIEGL